MLLASIKDYYQRNIIESYGYDVAILAKGRLGPLCTLDSKVVNDVLRLLVFNQQPLDKSNKVVLQLKLDKDLIFEHSLIEDFDKLTLVGLHLKKKEFDAKLTISVMQNVCRYLKINESTSLSKLLENVDINSADIAKYYEIYKALKKLQELNGWQKFFILVYSFDFYLNCYIDNEDFTRYESSKIEITDEEYRTIISADNVTGLCVRNANMDDKEMLFYLLMLLDTAGRLYALTRVRKTLEEWFEGKQYLASLINKVDKMINGDVIQEFMYVRLSKDASKSSRIYSIIRGALYDVIHDTVRFDEFTQSNIADVVKDNTLEEVKILQRVVLNSFTDSESYH